MASSKESYKQDLVVSIRYKNDLPPPPMGPKLLEIDTGGLQQYLDPGFAASIAKREEPNIEADAEGGMPIDVVGMYGYFEGDEASITAPDIAPPLDPEDELLMLTPDQLKSGGVVTGSNFLRKTQYMTATSAVTNDPTRSLTRVKRESKPKIVALPRDNKENIKMSIQKAFDLAYPSSKPATTSYEPLSRQDREAWSKPVHPTNRSLRPVSVHPILPDLDAATVIGQSWNLLRFDKPPLTAVKGHRDNRLDAAFLMANAHPEETDHYNRKKEAYNADPKNFEDPGNAPVVWSLLLPRDQGSTPLIRRITNSRDPEHADAGLYARVADPDENDSNKLKIPFDRVRYYSNAISQDKEPGRHTRQVVLTMPSKGDGTPARYYPIGQTNRLRPDAPSERTGWRAAFEAELPDQVLVEARDPNFEELANRYNDREEYDPSYASTFAEIMAQAKEERRARGEDDDGEEEDEVSKTDEVPEVPSQERENGVTSQSQDVSANQNGDVQDVEMDDVQQDQVENDDD